MVKCVLLTYVGFLVGRSVVIEAIRRGKYFPVLYYFYYAFIIAHVIVIIVVVVLFFQYLGECEKRY